MNMKKIAVRATGAFVCPCCMSASAKFEFSCRFGGCSDCKATFELPDGASFEVRCGAYFADVIVEQADSVTAAGRAVPVDTVSFSDEPMVAPLIKVFDQNDTSLARFVDPADYFAGIKVSDES